MTEFVTHSEQETNAIGRTIAALLVPGSIVVLTGPLGSGKTALVRGICQYFGCDDQLSSPTFTIINIYNGRQRIYHCDLYRLHRPDELFAAGFEDALYSDGIIVVEWAERALSLLPERRHEIALTHGDAPDVRRLLHHHRIEGEPSLLEMVGEREESGR
jgi:tRNA threonylcarbamoyladenosine biosynthesis protein TsaE